MKENYTKMLLPKGEWLESMLIAFANAKMPLVSKPRSYEYEFVDTNLPITFYAVRSKEVLGTIKDPDTVVWSGFTGTDIAEEQEYALNDANWEFPLAPLNPKAPKPVIYLGKTPNLKIEVSSTNLADIKGTTVYTEYPTITNRFFENALVEVNIKTVQGGSEGRWRLDPDNGAIVTVRNTDATRRANNIEPVVDILKAGVIFVAQENLQTQDQLRIDDLREFLYLQTNKL